MKSFSAAYNGAMRCGEATAMQAVITDVMGSEGLRPLL